MTTRFSRHAPAAPSRPSTRADARQALPALLRQALLWLCLMLAGACAAADGFRAQRLAEGEQVRLDGTLDAPVWNSAPVHDAFYEAQPADKLVANVRTEVRMLYDRRYLYIGVRAFDPDGAQIRSPFARRDKVSNDQDYIGLFLDPSGSAKSAQVIYVNARGAITDGAHSPANGDDLAPDFNFDVATARFDGGWTMIARIPFSSIAYTRDGGAPWKLLVMRNRTREQRYRMYSAPVTRNTNCILCFATPIAGLRDLPTGLNWTATPQLVLGRGRTEQAGTPTTRTSNRDLSLDVKLRPDSATVIDATIKPDFSQVELDAPQLSGNTRFGLFVQEKRPFFLEGSDILQTPFRAIYTRTIGAPSWGARYTRRDAGSDITLLSAHDAAGGLVQLPGPYGTGYAIRSTGSLVTVARATFKRDALAFGLVGTDRRLDGGRGYNRVAGSDLIWQPSVDDRMRAQLLFSATTAQPDGAGALAAGARTSGHAGFFDWTHDRERWSIQFGVQDVSDAFRADNGFFSQVGYRYLTTQMARKLGRTGPFNEMNIYVYADRRSDSAGQLISSDLSTGVWMAGPYDSELEFHVRPGTRSRIERGGEVYRAANVGGRVGGTPGPVLARLQAEFTYGEQVDVVGTRVGKGGNLTLYARIRPSERIEFEPNYTTNWIDGRHGPEQGRRLYTEQAAQLNGIYHFGAHDSLRMIVQRTRTRRDPALYAHPVPALRTGNVASFVYGHTPGLGTAAYIGVTRSRGEAPGNVPRLEQNEAFLKLSWQI